MKLCHDILSFLHLKSKLQITWKIRDVILNRFRLYPFDMLVRYHFLISNQILPRFVHFRTWIYCSHFWLNCCALGLIYVQLGLWRPNRYHLIWHIIFIIIIKIILLHLKLAFPAACVRVRHVINFPDSLFQSAVFEFAYLRTLKILALVNFFYLLRAKLLDNLI